jgi:hypothetical protein
MLSPILTLERDHYILPPIGAKMGTYVVGQMLAVIDGRIAHNLQIDNTGGGVHAFEDQDLINDGRHRYIVVTGHQCKVIDSSVSYYTL